MRSLHERLPLEDAAGDVGLELDGEAKEVLDFTPPYREVAYRDAVKEVMGDDWFGIFYA